MHSTERPQCRHTPKASKNHFSCQVYNARIAVILPISPTSQNSVSPTVFELALVHGQRLQSATAAKSQLPENAQNARLAHLLRYAETGQNEQLWAFCAMQRQDRMSNCGRSVHSRDRTEWVVSSNSVLCRDRTEWVVLRHSVHSRDRTEWAVSSNSVHSRDRTEWAVLRRSVHSRDRTEWVV